MRGALRPVLLLAVTITACRDLKVPDDAPAGSVKGRVTFAVPGRADRKPAAGAVASLLGTANETTTNPSGVFTLPNVDVTSGLLYFRYDSDSDGVVDRQRMLELADFGTGPHRAVDVGEVVLGENASATGRVLLADLGSARSGHRGTTVFVPEGPFSATTADDGSFFFPALPPGPLQFYVYRVGYVAVSAGQVELRSGEDYRFRDITLQPDTGPQLPGFVTGRLAFSPGAAGKGDSAVELTASLGGVVADDLTFRVDAPPGLYVLAAKRSGYSDARVPNVLVLPGAETTIGAVLLTDRPVLDAGALPASDAGATAPDDGGTADAGVTDAGTPCGSTSQCGAGEWCDLGFCRPQCSASVACTGGRSCDPATNTCVRPCSAGCSSGSACQASSGFCRPACDLTFGCAGGFSCKQGLCLPECGPGQPACPAHQMCQSGACVSDQTCDDDLGCPSDLLCRNGKCDARPTSRGDAGTFTCNGACQCRLGEWCSAGQCLPDAVPTLRVSADSGVDVPALVRDAGPNTVLALRSGDRFYSEAPFRFGIGAHGAVFGGGYVACTDTRWVRSDATRSTLVVDAGTALIFGGASLQPVLDASVHNFVLDVVPESNNCRPQLDVVEAVHPTVQRIEGHFIAGSCGGFEQSLVGFSNASLIDAQDITVEQSGPLGNWLHAVTLDTAYGTVSRARVATQTGTVHYRVNVVSASNPSGPLTIRGTRLDAVTASDMVQGVTVTSGNNSQREVIVEDSVLRWPAGTTPGAGFIGVLLTRQVNVKVLNNVIDGAGTIGPHHTSATGIGLDTSGGVISGNRITPPVANATAPVDIKGIWITNPSAELTVTDNAILGGDVTRNLDGIEISVVSGGGPVTTVARNVIAGGRALRMGGMRFSYVSALHVLDNDVSVSGHGVSCSGGTTVALAIDNAHGLIERNRLAATNAETVAGVVLGIITSSNELYANHIWAGPNTCFMSNPRSIGLWCNDCGQLWLGGNTIEAEGSPTMPGGTEGFTCEGQNTPLVFVDSNVIGGGSAASHLMLAGRQSCFQPDSFTNNHLWYRRATSGTSSGEHAFDVVDAGVGVADGRGNLIAGNVSPFDAPQPLRPDGGTLHDFRLAAGSPAIDTGRISTRVADGTPVTLDLFGLPRDAGAGPDMGCCERR